MLHTCSDTPADTPASDCTIRSLPKIKCDVRIKNRVRKVFFDPATGKVFDKDKNYLGQGVYSNDILVITRTTYV